MVSLLVNPPQDTPRFGGLIALPIFTGLGVVGSLPSVALAAVLAGGSLGRQRFGGLAALAVGLASVGLVIWAVAPGINLQGDLDFLVPGALLAVSGVLDVAAGSIGPFGTLLGRIIREEGRPIPSA